LGETGGSLRGAGALVAGSTVLGVFSLDKTNERTKPGTNS
jgi:hypothetical protein